MAFLFQRKSFKVEPAKAYTPPPLRELKQQMRDGYWVEEPDESCKDKIQREIDMELLSLLESMSKRLDEAEERIERLESSYEAVQRVLLYKEGPTE